MKYENLSQQQKKWIAEVQKSFSEIGNREDPRVECNPKTGEITEFSTCGCLLRTGWIPLKAIPYRKQMLEQVEREERILSQPIQRSQESPKLLRAEGEHHVHMYLSEIRRYENV